MAEDIEQASPSEGAQVSSGRYKTCCSIKNLLTLVFYGLACFGVGFGLGFLTYEKTKSQDVVSSAKEGCPACPQEVETHETDQIMTPEMETCLEGSLSLLAMDDEFLRRSLHTAFDHVDVDCEYDVSVDPNEYKDEVLPCFLGITPPCADEESSGTLGLAACEEMEQEDLESSWELTQFKEDCEDKSGEFKGFFIGEDKGDTVTCSGYLMPEMGAALEYLWMCINPPNCTDLNAEQLKNVSLAYLNKELEAFENKYAVICKREDITAKVELVSKCRKDFQVNRGAICHVTEDQCAFAIDLSSSDAKNCGQYCEDVLNATCLHGGGYDEDCTKDEKVGCDQNFTDDRCVCAWK